MFHVNTLNAAISQEDGSIRPSFEGVFVYLFILGSLFEAWMSPSMTVDDRVLAALRARFWLHNWHKHILYLTARLPDLYSPAWSSISSASFQIFNHLCDTLILLILAYSHFYPTIPFCIWVFGTSFVEHFFGIARQLLPNFSYAEFLKMVQHIMVCQRILESGVLKSKREQDSATGYIFSANMDMRAQAPSPTQLTPASLSEERLNDLVRIAYDEAFHICRDILLLTTIPRLRPGKTINLHPLGAPSLRVKKVKKQKVADDTDYVSDTELEDEESDSEDDSEDPSHNSEDPSSHGIGVSSSSIDSTAEQASSAAARYSALCTDLDDIIEEAALSPEQIASPAPHNLPKPPSGSSPFPSQPKASQIIDHLSNTISVEKMVNYRRQVQSGTVVKSECTVTVSPKYAIAKVPQDLNPDLKKQETKKTRQIRWENIAKGIQDILKSAATLTKSVSPNVSQSELLNIGSKNVTLLHVLQRDSFTVNAGNEIDEDDVDDEVGQSTPNFICTIGNHKFHLHTHASVGQLIYHLGKNALTGAHSLHKSLTPLAASHWHAVQWAKTAIPTAPSPLKIRIPGGNMK
ncbi:hypothetical protein NLJ89_g3093 [Agrocybe chaxingu]|uniref:Uncharacterized protein n=1 Tax=Agrocybe chaxingu TaxID=84603 RepID=A0A9W8MXL7_9AGAR|nr:hypothetical protein NLJ89_g3093 [Agrocybe chaxingu]